jgi:mannonate dehydratase
MLCYTHADGATIEGALDAVEAKRQRGFTAIRVQAGVPGLSRIYGVHGPEDGADDPHAAPIEGDWDTPSYLRHSPKLFEAARDRFGPELHLLHDAHHRLSPNEAAQLGKSLEPYQLFWVEDPVPAEAQDAWRRVREQTTTPLAVGEVFNSIWDARTLITERLIDYIRSTIVHAGGVTHVRRIADLAALYHVRTGFHGANDLSPVTMGTALHFGRWVPNFGIQEYASHPGAASEVFKWDWSYRDGHLHSGEAPGHGVTFDEAAAARFPYQRRYLDVNRLKDGTMWDW